MTIAIATPTPRPLLKSELLSARALERDYQVGGELVRAVRGIDLDVTAGEYVAIVGPSGCGKSTLLNLLGAIDRPTSGTVAIRALNVGAMTDTQATLFRLHNIGFVFQRFYLMPTLTARENVELPMAEAGVRSAERAGRAHELLEYVGLADRERHRPTQLSGGEQQRVAIALFGRLNAKGTTIIVVTHDEELAAAAQRVIHMRDGRIIADETRRRGT